MDMSIAAGRGKRDVHRAQPRKSFAESSTPRSPRSAQKKKRPRGNDEGSDELYSVRQILDEKTEDGRLFYLIDWEGIDPKTGRPYPPSWVFHNPLTMSLQLADIRNNLGAAQERYSSPNCGLAEQEKGARYAAQRRSSHARLNPRKPTCTPCQTPENCAKLQLHLGGSRTIEEASAGGYYRVGQIPVGIGGDSGRSSKRNQG
jgi:hypothetical protein